jgi:hypothetical protein
LRKFLHDWVGFGAAAMVAAMLLHFAAPAIESILGADRTGVLLWVVFGLFAAFGVRYFLRFLRLLTARQNEHPQRRDVE